MTSGPPPFCSTERVRANASDTTSSASALERTYWRATVRAAPACRS
ncbi:Uncharacterised protein [Mycobacteroides abscessus]|nr:Uncharacterised protein [Mycobacteroides abscessus]